MLTHEIVRVTRQHLFPWIFQIQKRCYLIGLIICDV